MCTVIGVKRGREYAQPGERYLCPVAYCGAHFGDSYTFARHQREVHQRVRKHQCTIDNCGETFTKTSGLRRHIHRHHGEGAWKPPTGDRYCCGQCYASFATTYGVARHEREVHQGVRKHQCTTCGESFTKTSGLVRHIRRHHTSERPFCCTGIGCDRRFTTKEELLEHERCVHEWQP